MPEIPSVPLVSQISLLAVMPHDLGEAQRDDGQIVAAEPGGHQRHHGAGRRGEHQRARHAEHHRHAATLGGQGRDVGAEGEEADEAEVDHAGHAPDEVQAERHERVEAGERCHRDQVVLHLLVPSTHTVRRRRSGSEVGALGPRGWRPPRDRLGWAPPRGGRTVMGCGNESQRPHLGPAPPAAADRSTRDRSVRDRSTRERLHRVRVAASSVCALAQQAAGAEGED